MAAAQIGKAWSGRSGRWRAAEGRPQRERQQTNCKNHIYRQTTTAAATAAAAAEHCLQRVATGLLAMPLIVATAIVGPQPQFQPRASRLQRRVFHAFSHLLK